eukprot:6404352-Pyramimonas_sp.AAC.1
MQADCPCELLPPPVGEGAFDDFTCLARPGGCAQSLGHWWGWQDLDRRSVPSQPDGRDHDHQWRAQRHGAPGCVEG